ncbi:histone H1/5 [Cryptococcus neoformans]|nr:histone H1/5 [Cryptococcus neoformans var. grubii c45]OXB38551.1 histone H1/5 [Cryptococcus neoformans var. grubii]OXC63006.1 histone H1/5 [Cryptococcus neoformans var. grubii MW-RSA852]
MAGRATLTNSFLFIAIVSPISRLPPLTNNCYTWIIMAPVKKTVATPRKATAHPTFLSMIQECISQNKGDARKGVSRPTIKKFLADKYKLDMSSAANISNLSNAIKRGAEKGQLTLPSGIAGRVKAGPKKPALVLKKSASGKENVAPKKAVFAKKAASTGTRKHAAKKGATAPAAIKAVPAKEPAAKKAAPAVKKTPSSKKAHAPKDAVPEKAAPRKKAAPKMAAA